MNEDIVLDAACLVNDLIGDRNVDDLGPLEILDVANEYVAQVPDASLRDALTLAIARMVIKQKSPEAEARFRVELDRVIPDYAAEHGLDIPVP